MAVELPPAPVHFVNRDQEKATAFRAFEERRQRQVPAARPLVLSLSGPGGFGKTELAFVIARELRDHFPDGVLAVDLDDFRWPGAGELDPGDVLGQLLGSLDVEPEWMAGPFKARCKQYWNKTADKRLLLVVDNARYASEVVPLLPASGAAVVIVASHGPLYDLEDGAAVELALPPLEDPEAMELLELIVDRDRTGGTQGSSAAPGARTGRLAADPEAARAVVRLCDGLPAALQVAGRWVLTHPMRPLSRLLTELRAELDDKGLPLVERVWDAAYHGLPPQAALLYRLLGHYPGPTFSQEAATALLGHGPDACADALEELGRAGLLDTRDLYRTPDGRMRLPQLLRRHALRRARQDAIGDDEQAGAQDRLLHWFVRQSQRADRFAAGARLLVSAPVGPLPDAPDVPLADPASAADRAERSAHAQRAARWLYTERHTLVACVRLAHARGLDAEAVALCEPVWTYALDHPHRPDVVDAFRLGVASAVRSGHVPGIVRMRCQLARHLWEAGEVQEAEREMESALSALDLLGDSERDRKLGASAVEFRGMLHSVRGDRAAAAQDFARSRDVHAAIPNPYGVMLQTYRLGQVTAELGDLEEAARLLAEAHASAAALERERMTARTGFALGGVLRRVGRTGEARGLYEKALTAADERGSEFERARVLDAFAELAETEQDGEEAARRRAEAAAIRRRNGLL